MALPCRVLLLQADYSLQCRAHAGAPFTSRYTALLAYASCFVLVYPVGIPVLYAVLLVRHRAEIRQLAGEEEAERQPLVPPTAGGSEGPQKAASRAPSPVARLTRSKTALALPAGSPVEPLRFLVEPFRGEVWFFALVDVGRRVLYAALQYSVKAGSAGQLMFLLILSLVYGTLLHHLRPYREASNQTLAVVGFWQVLLTIIGTIAKRLQPSLGLWLEVLLVLTSTITVAWALSQFASEIYEKVPVIRKQATRVVAAVTSWRSSWRSIAGGARGGSASEVAELGPTTTELVIVSTGEGANRQ
jgi:hypothetical protein